jgi:hypothetical protein
VTPAPSTAPEPIVVPFEWEDASIGRVTLECRFTVEGMRHIVDGHFNSLSEPWDRLMPRELIDRLVLRSHDGALWIPSLEDFHAFVDRIAAAMSECCRRPMLCLCSERVLATRDNGGMRPARHSVAVATVVFVLRSGASVFVKVDQEPSGDCLQLSGRLASCYFPRGRAWESPRRAHAAIAWRIVSQWAEHSDRCGNRKLPAVEERFFSDRGDKLMERRGIRFFSPATWGFRPSADSVLVFQGVPSWKT